VSRPFKFKEFTISQENAPMKVGTDGVLLGAWSECEGAQNILDIGSGTALIALMMAQRNTEALITAIEPNENALIDARSNIQNSTWHKRIDLIESSISDFSPSQKFDLIISNPPFFEKAPYKMKAGRAMARQFFDFNYDDLARAGRWLKPGGVLAGIYPEGVYGLFHESALKQSLFPKRLCRVKPTPFKKVHRVLFEYQNHSPENLLMENLIIEVDGRHQYSNEYRALTRNFYLSF
jgi:tRNA1Val (adenine37-N6)-methyltransferase